jgi:CubicO group peptidase (beta-lactamase class C family)/formylglycine-generating enzyme required for sulfatase activity
MKNTLALLATLLQATLIAFTLSFVDILAGDTPPIKLAPVLQPFVESHALAGAVVLVANPDKVLDVEAVGWADIASKKPMRPDCLFWVASQSKPITATALMILVDEGKVNVDDPVEKYLPEFKGQQVNVSTNTAKPELKPPRHPILVREVLSHTSGLPFKSDMEQPTLDLFSLATRVKSYAKMALLFEPGTKSQYSNAGINTAGRIVEVVSGMSFEKFLDERIFKPLGMTDTSFFPSKSQLERLAKAYKPNAAKDNLEECEITQLKYPLDDHERQSMPAGGLFSTANDFSIFYRMIANKGIFNGVRILSEKSVQQMTSDQSGEAKSSYGFGFGTNGRIVTHGGAYNSMSRFDHEHQLITIFLGQHAGWIKDGKTIISTFQKTATDAYGSKVKSKPNGGESLPDVGIPALNPTKPVAALATKQAVITNSIGMKLVRIEPGSFTMGQDGPSSDYEMKKHPAEIDHADWDEKPAHKVTITRPFHLGATEVTLAQYRQFSPKYRDRRGADDDAVVGVSWNDVVKFCEWLSAKEDKTYRLPTEAEWEYACRAGTTTLFSTGDTLPAGFQKWFGEYGRRSYYFPGGGLPAEYQLIDGKPQIRVAQTLANAWGLFDMHGNVAEWCADWYGPYQVGARTDPSGRSDGDFRVFRGGTHSTFSRLLRSANRAAWVPEARNETIGFRVVLGELPRGQMLPPPPPALYAQNVRQSVARITTKPADKPFFAGPQVFVKISPDSIGPMFSRHNHSPTITECPNGDLLASWFSCVDEGGSELCDVASRLRFGTAEWEPASPFWDGADINDHAPKLWWDGDKTIYHFARGFAENIVRTSTDNGATWGKARVLYPHDEFGNQVIRTREGFLIIPFDHDCTSFLISRDAGLTWTHPDADRGPSDNRPGGKGLRNAGFHAGIVQLMDGRLMTMGRYDKPDLQAKFGGKTPVSYSSDMGETWTYEASEFPVISSAQRLVLMRLREGPLLLCSFTDQARDWKTRKGLLFKTAEGGTSIGYGLFAALSFDEGKSWSHRRLITPGGPSREAPSIDRSIAIFSDTMSEHSGYLAAAQTRDGNVQLVSSKNHYAFNLAWLKSLPPAPTTLR